MNVDIEKTLSDRSEFKALIEEDVAKNTENLENTAKEIDKLSSAIENVKLLGEKPEWDGIIPLCKRLYIPGKIVHTGEYFLEKKSHPYSFSVLTTKDKTLEILESKKELYKEYMEKYKEIERQLEERIELLGGKGGVSDAPDKIESDRGIAVKVGEFYEIIEYE